MTRVRLFSHINQLATNDQNDYRPVETTRQVISNSENNVTDILVVLQFLQTLEQL
jgi:hypothetical protein